MAATRCALTCRPLYDSCTCRQCCFRIVVNKEWWGWDGGGMTYCLITCYQMGVQHSHITIMKGAVIRRNLHKQTCQTQSPWTDLVHESLGNSWHVRKIQKKIFWIISGFQLGIYYNHCINLGNLVCCSLIHSCNLKVSQDGCTKF
jgi:hypothetical protein